MLAFELGRGSIPRTTVPARLAGDEEGVVIELTVAPDCWFPSPSSSSPSFSLPVCRPPTRSPLRAGRVPSRTAAAVAPRERVAGPMPQACANASPRVAIRVPIPSAGAVAPRPWSAARTPSASATAWSRSRSATAARLRSAAASARPPARSAPAAGHEPVRVPGSAGRLRAEPLPAVRRDLSRGNACRPDTTGPAAASRHAGVRAEPVSECGGLCPSPQVCVPNALGKCDCQSDPTCSASPYPQCGGVCPAPQVCTPNAAGACTCGTRYHRAREHGPAVRRAVSHNTPVACRSGTTVRLPIARSACDQSPFPQCGGTCPTGTACRPDFHGQMPLHTDRADVRPEPVSDVRRTLPRAVGLRSQRARPVRVREPHAAVLAEPVPPVRWNLPAPQVCMPNAAGGCTCNAPYRLARRVRIRRAVACARTRRRSASSSREPRPCGCQDVPTPCQQSPFPQCGGTCPAGTTCRPDPTGKCNCIPTTPPCDQSPYPTCGGLCPSPLVCVSDALGHCQCENPTPKCAQSPFPQCGGVCPSPLVCLPDATGSCNCVDPVPACAQSPFPQCGGLCPTSGPICVAVSGTVTCGCQDQPTPCQQSPYPQCARHVSGGHRVPSVHRGGEVRVRTGHAALLAGRVPAVRRRVPRSAGLHGATGLHRLHVRQSGTAVRPESVSAVRRHLSGRNRVQGRSGHRPVQLRRRRPFRATRARSRSAAAFVRRGRNVSRIRQRDGASCVPLPCVQTPYPQCGGGCPPGTICQPGTAATRLPVRTHRVRAVTRAAVRWHLPHRIAVPAERSVGMLLQSAGVREEPLPAVRWFVSGGNDVSPVRWRQVSVSPDPPPCQNTAAPQCGGYVSRGLPVSENAHVKRVPVPAVRTVPVR